MKLRTTRIAVFIDHANFQNRYQRAHRRADIPFAVWSSLHMRLVQLYQDYFPFPEHIDLIGIWITIAIPLKEGKTDQQLKFRLADLDRLQKFIVKYGFRKKKKEKAVDTEIVCQMMMGAFREEYDVAMILSDDSDYIPAVHRIQDYFGKKVIQVGYETQSRLRAACFGHIPLEEHDAQLLPPKKIKE